MAEVIILTSVIMILSYKFAISLGMLNLLKNLQCFTHTLTQPTNRPTLTSAGRGNNLDFCNHGSLLQVCNSIWDVKFIETLEFYAFAVDQIVK